MLIAGAASQKYMQKLADQQEVMGAIADMVIEVFAMDSALLRARKYVAAHGEQKPELVVAMTQVYLETRVQPPGSRGQEGRRGRSRRRHAAHPDGDCPPPGQA